MIMNYSLQFHKVVLGKAILKGIHCSRGGGEGKLEYLQEILPQINIKFFTSFNFPGCQNSYFLAKLWFFKSYIFWICYFKFPDAIFSRTDLSNYFVSYLLSKSNPDSIWDFMVGTSCIKLEYISIKNTKFQIFIHFCEINLCCKT